MNRSSQPGVAAVVVVVVVGNQQARVSTSQSPSTSIITLPGTQYPSGGRGGAAYSYYRTSTRHRHSASEGWVGWALVLGSPPLRPLSLGTHAPSIDSPAHQFPGACRHHNRTNIIHIYTHTRPFLPRSYSLDVFFLLGDVYRMWWCLWWCGGGVWCCAA